MRGISIALGRVANEVELHRCVNFESYGRLITIEEAIDNFEDHQAIKRVRLKFQKLKERVAKLPRVVRYTCKPTSKKNPKRTKYGSSRSWKKKTKKCKLTKTADKNNESCQEEFVKIYKNIECEKKSFSVFPLQNNNTVEKSK